MLAAVNLNHRAAAVVDEVASNCDALRIAVAHTASGVRLVDCGVQAPGGLSAGVALARICLADLGDVALVQDDDRKLLGPLVTVRTDFPWQACMASQYAGWQVKGDAYFAMGSGPMRACAAREPLFADLEFQETSEVCVGVLEASALPPDEVCVEVAQKCGVEPAQLTLLVASTKSLAENVQVVARSVETALHKLHELKFDVRRVVSAWGSAPLPPPAKDDLAAIGRTNDAVLYGGRTTLFVRGDDASIEEAGAHLPSSSSSDYGRPFAELFAEREYDFYRIDPLLFSPAQVTIANVDTGRAFRFGDVADDVLLTSFGL